ncbi:MAG TPA: hypothetical protein VNH65_17785 [Candidatus Acidoferrum sp.]|nr:hypothetical protein [Candidatus Acidoferrum sp.]
MGEDNVLTQTEAPSVYDRWMQDDRVEYVEKPTGWSPSIRPFVKKGENILLLE